MAIGTPTLILAADTSSPYSSGSPSNGTTVAAPVGSCVLVVIQNYATDISTTSFVDSVGNTYTRVQATAVTGVYNETLAYCDNTTVNLPIGSTFTLGNGGSQWVCVAYSVSGLGGGGVNTAVTINHAAGTSWSPSTGTLAIANAIVFSTLALSAAVGGTITPPSNLTNIYNDGTTSVDYEIVSANTSVAANYSWTPSQTYSGILIAFYATKTVFYLSGSSFTMPADFDPTQPWSLEAIGAGGTGSVASPAGGGAGAMYSKITQANLTPSAGQTVYCSIPAGPTAADTAGGDCWANFSTNAAPSVATAGVLAKGGPGASGGTGGTAPSSGGVGSVNKGGNGGTSVSSPGGGGGAGGPNGVGAAGGA